MTQHAKNPVHHQLHAKPAAAVKVSSTVSDTAKTTHKANDLLLKMEHENIKNLKHTADNSNHVATEYAGIFSDNISALTGSGNDVPRVFHEINSDIMGSWNQYSSDLAEISKEAFSCRTIGDVIGLQSKILQQAYDNYSSTTSKLCGLLFNSCSEAQSKINDRTAVASGHVRKALAA